MADCRDLFEPGIYSGPGLYYLGAKSSVEYITPIPLAKMNKIN